MQDNRKILGHHGEMAALSFLKSIGFKILETNYRTKISEIDIIADDHNVICFIEVKTRRNLKKGLPKESVTYSKQKKIILGATYFLKKKKLFNSNIRFDVAEVYKKNAHFEVNLIKNAFQAH